MNQEPKLPALPKVVETSPERIWLYLGFDPDNEDETDFNQLGDVTWSEDNATGYGIEYVRADIALNRPALAAEQEAEFMELVGVYGRAYHYARNDECPEMTTQEEREEVDKAYLAIFLKLRELFAAPVARECRMLTKAELETAFDRYDAGYLDKETVYKNLIAAAGLTIAAPQAQKD